MGSDVSKTYPAPWTQLPPGTYRIASVSSNTFLEVPKNDRKKVGAPSKNHTDRHQEWFVQRAGSGYQFKNCQSGKYLTALNTDPKAPLCASEFPTTWSLHEQGEAIFSLQFPLNDRVIHLELETSDSSNGNAKKTKITLRTSEDVPDSMRWRFEHVSNEVDTVDIESLKQELRASKEDNDRLRREIAELRQ